MLGIINELNKNRTRLSPSAVFEMEIPNICNA